MAVSPMPLPGIASGRHCKCGCCGCDFLCSSCSSPGFGAIPS